MKRQILAWLVFLSLGACKEREPIFSQPLAIEGPFILEDRLVYIDQTREEALFLLPKKNTKQVDLSRFKLGRNPQTGKVGHTLKRFIVLTSGSKGGPGDKIEAPKLFLFYLENQNLKEKHIELSFPFSKIEFSPDDRFVVLYGGISQKQEIKRADKIAILNLEEPFLEPKELYLGFPEIANIFFPPPFNIGGKKTRLVLIASKDSKMALISLEEAEKRVVWFKKEDSPKEVVPKKLLFFQQDPNSSPEIFVLARGSDDIYSLTLHEAKGERPNFIPSINQYGSGRNPTDILLYEEEKQLKLLVLNSGSKDLAVIDVQSANSVTIPLEEEKIDRFMLLERNKDEKLLFIFSSQGLNKFLTLELKDVERLKGRRLETTILPQPLLLPQKIPNSSFVLLRYNLSFALFDFQNQKIIPFSGTYSGDVITDFNNNLLVVSEDKMVINKINLESMETFSMRLDHRAGGEPKKPASCSGSCLRSPEFIIVGKELSHRGAMFYLLLGLDLIVVDHFAPHGRLTFVDQNSLERKKSFVYEGFLLSEILDIDPKQYK
jgi:hypothetical protein